MYPYQRGPGSSSSSSAYSYPGSQQQQPPPPTLPPPLQQRASSVHSGTGSPEQTRSHIMNRKYDAPIHDDFRGSLPSGQHSASHHSRAYSDMHDPREQDAHNHEGRRWMEEPQRMYGPPPPSDRALYSRQQTQPPPPSSHHQQHGSYMSSSTSHPASPSRRPRTPPQPQRGSYRPAPWDPVNSGPMSAPPTLFPRTHPGGQSATASTGGGSGSAQTHAASGMQQTSPVLPSLVRGNKNHSRIPSWGPHSSMAGNAPRNEGEGKAALGSSAGNSDFKNGSSHMKGSSNLNASTAPTGERLPPPPSSMMPYRGQSVGLGDHQGRSDFGQQPEKRKRPASESPPNASVQANGPVQQSSPTQRGDPMSMSSILGPSARTTEADKRRRLEGNQSGGYQSSIKVESGAAAPSSLGLATSTSPSSKQVSHSLHDSPASNLARRKWSGPIAQEAAQQAAAWRAQEQQRWGSSRSPKVGLTPLGGSGPTTEQRGTPPSTIPMGGTLPLKRGNSPVRAESHRRQRSDGYPAIQESPPTRLRPLSPPGPGKQPRSRESSPNYGQGLPHMSRASPKQPYAPLQGGGQGGFYRPASPPMAMQHQQQHHSHHHPQQQHPQQQQQHQQRQNADPLPFTGPPQGYGQSGYHKYEGPNRITDSDVDDLRAGNFGDRVHPRTSSQDHDGYRQSGAHYNDTRHPAGHVREARPSATANSATKTQSSASGNSHRPPPSTSAAGHGLMPAHARSSAHSSTPSRAAVLASKEVEQPKQRSITPNIPGPAHGLLAPRVEKARSGKGARTHRVGVPLRDFNDGPRVDSEAVFETLEQTWRRQREDEGVVLTDEVGDASSSLKNRFLGSFLYDPRQSPLLPGELLLANVGATLEVRIAGRHLGVGPSADSKSKGRAPGAVWRLGRRSEGGDVTNKVRDAENMKEEDALAFWEQDALLNRKLWGTDVYTDDSDIVAMCIHAGWIEGPSLQEVPSWVPPGKAVTAWRQLTKIYEKQGLEDQTHLNGVSGSAEENFTQRREELQSTADLSVTIRVAPQLIAYKGSQRSGVKSRSWGNGHDGVSLVIEKVTLQEPGYASVERGLKNAKLRIDHLARLKTLATIAIDSGAASVAPTAAPSTANENVNQLIEAIRAGALVDIGAAANLSKQAVSNEDRVKPFWSIDVKDGKIAAA